VWVWEQQLFPWVGWSFQIPKAIMFIAIIFYFIINLPFAGQILRLVQFSVPI
jgi:hypothetical protein